MSATLKTTQAERKDKVNFFYVLEDHAKSKKYAHAPFIAYEEREWTYKEVYDTVLQYATWMKSKYAVAPREVVAMDYMNSAEFVFIFLAIWSLGARPALINYNLTGEPLLHCLDTSTARIVFVDEEVQSLFNQDLRDKVRSRTFRDGQGAMAVVVIDTLIKQEIEKTQGVREPDEARSGVKLRDMSSLIYTSGTTGLPKAGIVSWGKNLVSATFCGMWLGLRRNDRFYTVCFKTLRLFLST